MTKPFEFERLAELIEAGDGEIRRDRRPRLERRRGAHHDRAHGRRHPGEDDRVRDGSGYKVGAGTGDGDTSRNTRNSAEGSIGFSTWQSNPASAARVRSCGNP